MFDVGGGELLLIVLAVIVLFGPQKLPEIAQMFGKGMRKVRDAQAQFNKQVNTIKQEINTTVNSDINNSADSYDKMKQQIHTPGIVVVDTAQDVKVTAIQEEKELDLKPDFDSSVSSTDAGFSDEVIPPPYSNTTNSEKPLG